VIDATANPAEQLQVRTAARTRLARYGDSIPRAVAEQRRAPPAEVGADQLALIHRAAAFVQHLEDELRLDQVDAVALGAAVPGRPELGHSGVVEGHGPVRGLESASSRGDARARLPGVDRGPDSRSRASKPQLVRPLGH